MYKIDNLQFFFVLILLLFTFFFNNDNSIIFNSLNEYYLISLTLMSLIFVNKFFKNKLFEIFITFFLIFFLFRFFVLLCFNQIQGLELSTLIVERSLNLNEVANQIKKIKYYIFLMFFSLIIFKTDLIYYLNKSLNNNERNTILQFCLLLFILIFVYNFYLHKNASGLNFIIQIFFNVYNWATILPIILVALFSYTFKDIKKKHLISYLFLIVLFYLLSVISSGSKSGILFIVFFVYLLFYIFKFDEKEFVKKILLYAPLLIILTILFWLSGILVPVFAQYESLDFYVSVRSETQIFSQYLGEDPRIFYPVTQEHFLYHIYKKFLIDYIWLLDSIFYRIGYFDFYLDKSIFIEYKDFINISYYFKSFIDKITPGFDIYGVPLASRALYFAYFGYFPTNTQSEQMTMFAESAVLFGNYYFLYYLILSLFLKFMFFLNFKIFKNIFLYNLSNFYLIYFYFNLLTGFGIDTHLMELFYYYLIVLSLYLVFIITNKSFYK